MASKTRALFEITRKTMAFRSSLPSAVSQYKTCVSSFLNPSPLFPRKNNYCTDSHSHRRLLSLEEHLGVHEMPLPYPHGPLLMFRGYDNAENDNYRFFSPAEDKFLKFPISHKPFPEDHEISPDSNCGMTCNGWLGYVNDVHDCRFYLANIFSPQCSPRVIRLPPVETLKPFVISYERDPSSKYFDHYIAHNYKMNLRLLLHPSMFSDQLLRSMAMSSNPNEDEIKNCTIMISHSSVRDLAFCRIGDAAWTNLERLEKGAFVRIVYSNKDRMFYALSSEGYVQGWDLNNPSSPRSIKIKINNNFGNRCYLVETPQGDLLHVNRYISDVKEDGSFGVDKEDYFDNVFLPYRTERFDVHKIDVEKQKAEPVECLEDTALFLGASGSFSVSAKNFPGLRPNSIYFDDDWYHLFDLSDESFGGHDIGIFSLENKTVSPVYQPYQIDTIEPAPIWVLPQSSS